MSKQWLTISITGQTLRNLRVLAARRGTSLSDLVAEQIERLVVEGEEAYGQAQQRAMMLLNREFHMGGVTRTHRDELHER